MNDICRLCCSSTFVNNHIFDEENALYLKMSLYLPIKVFKNDRLPQKVCDKCSCKVNDFYQFCNETIEVQNRLRAALLSSSIEIEDSIDLTLIKQNDLSPLPPALTDLRAEQKVEPDVDHDIKHNTTPTTELTTQPTPINRAPQYSSHQQHSTEVVKPKLMHVYTQTDNNENKEISADDINTTLFQNVRVKEEPKPQLKVEEELPLDDFSSMSMFICNDNDTNVHSDNSEDDISLIKFKKKKRSKKEANGVVQKKKKPKLKEWEMLMRALPEGTALTMVDPAQHDLKVDVKEEPGLEAGKKVKTEPVEFHCCICFVQCYSRSEMLQHYKEHAAAESRVEPPAAPAPPDGDPAKCPRCQKRLCSGEWAAHWLAHWRRDARPYRCALCEKTFRDHHQILKHGLTHKSGEEGALSPAPPEKRFICDQCPEGFVYMRYLLAHRASRHPEALGRPLLLRCPSCGRQFAHLNSLRRHLRAHSGERNFLCNVCGKALSSREHLKFHIRIHTGYKPNVCKTCGKGFVKKCNLTLHERVHSGEKPHVCSHCGKAFSQRSTLVIHERYHSGARPYVCALCGRGFVAKGLLSMHLKTTCI